MNIKIKRLHPRAELPMYATPGAACFDLHSIEDGYVNVSASFRTGLAVEIPEGHVMLIYSRSGHGFRNGVRLANCVGVIDSDYRGEICVKLTNDSETPFDVFVGNRIAQAMIIPVDRATFEVVDELSSTERGEGGMGSTGQ